MQSPTRNKTFIWTKVASDPKTIIGVNLWWKSAEHLPWKISLYIIHGWQYTEDASFLETTFFSIPNDPNTAKSNRKFLDLVLTQSWLTLRDPTVYSPPGSSVCKILQARILERVAISYSTGSSPPRIEPTSPASPALAGRFFITEPPGRPPHLIWYQRIWHEFFLPSWHIASTWFPKHSIFSCSSFQDLGHFSLPLLLHPFQPPNLSRLVCPQESVLKPFLCPT